MGTLSGNMNWVKSTETSFCLSPGWGAQAEAAGKHGETSQLCKAPGSGYTQFLKVLIQTSGSHCLSLANWFSDDPLVFWIPWVKIPLYCTAGRQCNFTPIVFVHKPRWSYFSGFLFQTDSPVETKSACLWKAFLDSLLFKVFPSCLLPPSHSLPFSSCSSFLFHKDWTHSVDSLYSPHP